MDWKKPQVCDSCHIVRPYYASQLCFADSCVFRAVNRSTDSKIVSLPAGPFAELGAIYHQLLQDTTRVPKASSQRSLDYMRQRFGNLLDEAERRLSVDPLTRHYANLKLAIGAVQLHRSSTSILMRAVQLMEHRPAAKVTSKLNSSVTSRATDGGLHEGEEVWLASESLPLAGRLDRLEMLSPMNWRVIDYKTGRISNTQGQLKSEVKTQLELYALLVAEKLPNANIDLLAVGMDTEYEERFTADLMGARLEWLDSIRKMTPMKKDIQVEAIASPGPSCIGCLIRHCCGAYIKAAPTMWKCTSSGTRLPLDIWGTVKGVRERSPAGIDLELLDSAGRRTRVFNVARGRFDRQEMCSGKKIWLFGLREFGGSTPSSHPRNFYEIPLDNVMPKAWDLCVFIDG